MVQADAEIDPETQEIWAGVRSPLSAVSELQNAIDDLEAALSGFEAYQQFLRDQSSFDDLENNLSKMADATTDRDGDDATDTRDFLEDTFTSFGDYKGDPEQDSGVYSNDTFDEYRTYLTDAGASDVDADRHIQFLKDLFSSDATVGFEAGTHDSWEALEQELIDNGVNAESAATTVERLRSVFPSVRAFDQQILISASWDEFDEYLEDNGLNGAEAGLVVNDLKEAYGDTLDSAVKDNFSQFETWADFNTWLQDQGFTQAEADQIEQQLKDQGLTIDDVRAILAESGLTGLLNKLPHGTDLGDSEAGLHIWEEAGTTLSGQSAVKGGVSIRGREVYLEQIDAPEDEGAASDVSWSGISADPNPVSLNGFTTISATASNTSNLPVSMAAKLIVDGETVGQQWIELDGNETRTVSIGWSPPTAGSFEARIATSPTVSITVGPVP